MSSSWPRTLPDCHRSFLISTIDATQRDARLVGVAAGGSLLADSIDEYSDLDLVIAVEPRAFDGVMQERRRIAGALGPHLAPRDRPRPWLKKATLVLPGFHFYRR